MDKKKKVDNYSKLLIDELKAEVEKLENALIEVRSILKRPFPSENTAKRIIGEALNE